MNTDNKLKEALIAQLNFWIGYSASNVQVTVNEGIVTLRGCVPVTGFTFLCQCMS